MLEQTLVFPESERFCRLFFERQPGFGEIVEADGIIGFCLNGTGFGKIIERVDKFLFESGEVFGGNFDVDVVAYFSVTIGAGESRAQIFFRFSPELLAVELDCESIVF